MDHTRNFGKDSLYCNLSKLEVQHYLAGHDHICDLNKGGHYLGSIGLNSKSESGKIPYIAKIDLSTKEYKLIEIPKTIEYYEVTYPNSLPKITTKYAIFTVQDSIDKGETIEYYRKQANEKGYEFYTNKILSKKLKEQVLYENEEEEERDRMEWFMLFKEQNKISEEVTNICIEVLNMANVL
jgi:hypothetical protein